MAFLLCGPRTGPATYVRPTLLLPSFLLIGAPLFSLFRRLGWRRELNVTFAREKKGEGTYGDTQFRAKKALEKKGEGGKKSFFPQKHTVAKRKLRSRKLRQINNMY